MARELRSAVPTSGRSRSAIISDALFVAGLVLTAVIMAWDRVPHIVAHPPYFALVDSRGLAPQELLAFLLLLQRGLVMAWDRIRRNGGAWPSVGLTLAFGLLAVATGVAALTAFNFKVAVIASLVFCFALGRGWLLAQYVRERELKMFENVVLWVLAVTIVLGYFQFLGDVYGLSQSWTQLLPQYNSTTGAYPFPRVQSFALEPLYLGHWMFLPLGILLTRYWRTRKASAFEQILLVLALGLFLLTLSRGAMLGLALAVFAIFVVGRSWRPLLYVARNGVFAVLLVAGLLLLASSAHDNKTAESAATTAAPNPSSPSTPASPAPTAPTAPTKPDVVGSFTGHALDVNDPSAQTRYDLWPQTIKIFIHHPFTGVGFNNARLLLHDGSASTSVAEANALQPVNNDYLTFLSELGVVGVLLALPLVWLVLKAMWGVARTRLDHLSSPYAFALVGMAFEANAFQSLSLLRTWVVVGLLIAGARLMRERPAVADTSDDLAETVILNRSLADTTVLDRGSVGSKTA
ncbi:O-antigen ligase family protein [Actinoplanes sp. KI2]|uniref:O-antigen ligase family protein n=1 Tax=Actinoplanes sp. KI2 TaxID=2983315 RepID=UPI0021D58557|nr:O-antigen ligase family protein [Actinoplanes sp. KI2]MCU7730402.1 O-antigen ligase family protein [Actinoplanes sp. KI2]